MTKHVYVDIYIYIYMYLYIVNLVVRINECMYVINLDDYKSVGAHWVALYVNGDKYRQQKYHNKCL